MKSLSRVQLFATPRTVAHQVSPSMEFSRQEYWTGLPFPSPGDVPDPEIEPRSPTLQVDSLPAKPQGKLKNTGVGSLSINSIFDWKKTKSSSRGTCEVGITAIANLENIVCHKPHRPAEGMKRKISSALHSINFLHIVLS